MNTKIKHSEDFIRKAIGNKTGFSVPQNYFEELENNTIAMLFSEEKIKKSQFKVPVNYFENLEDTIIARINSEEKKVKVISLRKRVFRFVPVAATAAVLLFFSLNYFSNSSITFDDITSNDLETWYQNDSENINDSELAMVLETSDFVEDAFSETTINDENLEEYLNTIDNTNLLIE